MVKKILLWLAVALTLIIIYFGFGKEPDYYLFSIADYRCGLSFFTDVGWKIASIVAWVGYIMYCEIEKEIKDDN